MKPAATPHVIVEASHGTYRVIPATLANAMALYEQHKDRLPGEVRAILEAREDKSRYLVQVELLGRALKEIVEGPVGALAPNLRRLLYGSGPARNSGEDDTRPQALVSAELRAEVAVWALEHNFDVQRLADLPPDTLQQSGAFEKLSICSGVRARAAGKPLLVVLGADLDMAEEVAIIEGGRWKADAKEERVVTRILSLVSEHLTHRDVNYEVTELVESV